MSGHRNRSTAAGQRGPVRQPRGGPAAVRFTARTREIAARDPLEVFAAGPADDDRFFWERPDEGLAVAAVGAVHAIEASGCERFARADRAAPALFASLSRQGRVPVWAGPLLVGGFAFADAPSPDPAWADFPPCRLVLPRQLVVRRGERCWSTEVVPAAGGAWEERTRAAGEPADGDRGGRGSPPPTSEAPQPRRRAPGYRIRADRAPAEHERLVGRALDAIAAGEIEKVVVARAVGLTADADFDVPPLLAALRRRHPSCATFAVARGRRVWLGATPERLLRVRGPHVEAAALAGTRPRGRSPEEDAELGRALCESKKEQAEHAAVVRALRTALAPHCRDLQVPEAPTLRRLAGMQHLETRIAGRLPHGTGEGLLTLAGSLHPTPAVGGAPRSAALRWIRRHEGLDRGWYAGPVGFVDATGGGELGVGLRAALLAGTTARLFAGGGIVEGALPRAELRETRLKLGTLLGELVEV